MKEKDSSTLPSKGSFPFHYHPSPSVSQRQKDKGGLSTYGQKAEWQHLPSQYSSKTVPLPRAAEVFFFPLKPCSSARDLGVQAGKAKPRERHKTYEGWWHHGGPRWEGGRRCWGPGTRIGNRLLRERKVIGPRMGRDGFLQKGSRGVKLKKEYKVQRKGL